VGYSPESNAITTLVASSCINAVIATEYDKHGSYRFVGNGNYAESPEAMREMATILRAWGDAELLAPNLIAIIMLV